MVRHRLQMLGTIVLWIDEAQDLFCTKGQAETRNILNVLKKQMQGEGSVIVVLSGVDELEQIARIDRQITRRFRTMRLGEVTEGSDGDKLWAVIEKFCSKVDLDVPERRDFVGPLIHACRGRFGLCIELTVDAIKIVLDAGDTVLDRHHFAEIFAAQTACDARDNVFITERWSQVDMDRLAFG